MKRNSKGFTLIELLIVVAIIGIIVAIAIPNLLNAIQRAKQRRSMGDIRTTATAIEAYAVDLNRYPPAAAYTLPIAINQTLSSISNYVSPTYVKQVPLSDGWNSWFMASVDGTGSIYALASAGRDGSATGLAANATLLGPTTDFNADIVYVNGSFIQWPEGVQR
ncbi:MAG TPA: type II secretion system protein GspG [Thermoanaerobaculia bacterium]|nr:type II secretion system protein GspG [Thermoanaerobaculia bacterium]